MKSTTARSGQIPIIFNWVYILIAGTVILLFIVGIVVRQKAIAEENLAAEVIQIMESIFTGAQVSEKTKSSISTGGLSEQTLYFRCEDGVGEYGVEGLPARTQNSLDPIFAPPRIQSQRLILWSQPYLMPFKITDFLMVTSVNHHYFLLGDGGGFTDKFIKSASDSDPRLSINVQKMTTLTDIDIKEDKLEDKLKIRIVDTDGTTIKSGERIPESLLILADDSLTALSITVNKEVNFFRKNGNSWKQLNLQPLPIVSQSTGRDAAYYGAIFSEDPKTYLCNMQKAYLRIRLIAEIYEGKVKELETHYQNSPESENCLGFIRGFIASEGNVKDTLLLYKTRARACSLLADSSCVEIIDFAERLKFLNKQIAEECSVNLY